MILSRTRFQETSHIVLDSFLMQRAVLHGKVAVYGGDLHLFCTHLSTPVVEVEYGGKFESWKAEQLAQVKRLIDFVEEQAGARPAVLLGDLNLGPAKPEWEVEAEFPDHFQLFLDASFRSPYTKDHGHCTFCGIEALGASGDGRILDHALFLNFPEALLLPERIMERNIALEGNVRIPLSDHYGVRVEFDMPSP
jgi:endonuclease/exonuclease/phosphatase family metal-dependent hydrolase